VEDALIHDLKGWVDTELDKLSLRPALRPGDSVQIVGGPMQGVSAVILRASDEQDRVTILLSILQHGAQLTLSRAQIERIPAVA